MIFDECFGEIPKPLHRLIRSANVSPAEFYMFEESGMSHAEMYAHIRTNLVGGTYRQPWPFKI